MNRFRRRYGAGPLHLLALLASFALAGYAVTRVPADGSPLLGIVVWFVGAAVAHDLVLHPLYAIADGAARTRARRNPGVPWINYLRVPVAFSALLLLIWFPLILGGRGDAFLGATGHTTDVYLPRWLAATGVLFLGSALLYALAVRRRTKSARHMMGSARDAQAGASRRCRRRRSNTGIADSSALRCTYLDAAP